MKVFQNFIYNMFYQIFLLIVPLITMPYVARVIGPTGSGINSYTSSIVSYFILFGSIGLSIYGNREIAYVRNNEKKLTNTFWSIEFLRIITLGLAIVFYMIFILFFSDNKLRIYYIFQGVTLLAAVFDISWFFEGVENFKITVTRNLIVKLISIILIFTLVKNSKDLGIYILIMGLSILCGNLTLWPYLKIYVKNFRGLNLDIFRHLPLSVILFVPQIATQVYLVLNQTMLGRMVSLDASGFYNYADQLVKIVMSVATALVTVMLPRVANAFAAGHMQKIYYYVHRSFRIVSFLSIPMMFGLSAIALKLAPWFYGSEFKIVGLLIFLESPVIVLIGWSGVLGTQYLLPVGRNSDFTKSVTYGAIINIIINIPFIIFWKTEGAVISTVISELTVTLLQLFYVRREINIFSLFKGINKYFIAGLIMFIVVFSINQKFPFNFVFLIAEVLIGIFVYLLLLYIFKDPILHNFKKKWENKNAKTDKK